MILRTKLEIAAACGLLIGAVLLGRTWLSEHDARLQAEIQSKVLTQAQQQNQQQIQILTETVKQVKDNNDKQIAMLADAVKNLKTPNDQLAWVISQLKVPQPISIQVPKDSNQPATVSVPIVDVPDIVTQTQACKACQLDLSTTKQQLSYTGNLYKISEDNLTIEKQKSHNWEVAAKGGTTWQRFVRATKWALVGGLVSTAVVCGSGHCK